MGGAAVTGDGRRDDEVLANVCHSVFTCDNCSGMQILCREAN